MSFLALTNFFFSNGRYCQKINYKFMIVKDDLETSLEEIFLRCTIPVFLEGVEGESEQKVCFFWISVCSSVKDHSDGDLSGLWALETKCKLCAYSKCLIVTTSAGCPSSNMHRFTLMKNVKVWVNFGFKEETRASTESPRQRVPRWAHTAASGRTEDCGCRTFWASRVSGVMQTGACHGVSLQDRTLPGRNARACGLS